MLECSISYALSLLNTTERCIPWYYPPVDPKVRMCSAFEARDFSKAIEKIPGGICEVINYLRGLPFMTSALRGVA